MPCLTPLLALGLASATLEQDFCLINPRIPSNLLLLNKVI